MALTRKTVFSLGGPEYIADPRVAEAQGWAALQQQDRAQQRQIAQAMIDSQLQADAQTRRAMIEGQSDMARSAQGSRHDDLQWAIENLRAQAGAEDTATKEAGWTGREQMRIAGEADRARATQEAEMERLLAARSLDHQREAMLEEGRNARALEDVRGKHADRLLQAILGMSKGPEPGFGDLLQLGVEARAAQSALDQATNPEGIRATIASMAPLGAWGEQAIAPAVQATGEKLGGQWDEEQARAAQSDSGWGGWLAGMSTLPAQALTALPRAALWALDQLPDAPEKGGLSRIRKAAGEGFDYTPAGAGLWAVDQLPAKGSLSWLREKLDPARQEEAIRETLAKAFPGLGQTKPAAGVNPYREWAGYKARPTLSDRDAAILKYLQGLQEAPE